LVVGSSVFIFLFLYIFEPFQIYTITDFSYKLRLILGYTLVPPFCVLFMIEVLGRIFPKVYHEKGWTIASEIMFVMGLVLLLAIGNFANSVLQNSDKIPATTEGFFSMLFYTGVISFFPAVAFVWFRHYRLNRYYGRPVQVIAEEALSSTEPKETEFETSVNESILTLVAENGKDKLMILPHHLCSLGRIESQITASHIRRCHRSYMVNLQKVYRVSGNAQGYKLHLWQVAEPLPVSRGYAKQVILSE
jgi:hypothetical protein